MISRSFYRGFQMFPLTEEELVSSNVEDVNSGGSGSSSHPSSLLFNLSILKEKLSQVQTLVGVILSPNQSLPDSTSMAISTMISTIHEIIVSATSMMYTCQHMMDPPGTSTTNACTKELQGQKIIAQSNLGNNNKVVLSNIASDNREMLTHTLNRPIDNIRSQGFFSSTESEALDWFSQTYNNNNSSSSNVNNCNLKDEVAISGNNNVPLGDYENNEGYKRGLSSSAKEHEIIELNASDLLAKYTHYCQVCGKGFRRDANLRMHMRAHGDEYKSSAALKNSLVSVKANKYSCPQEGCRWNLKHAKFQPLKSMICAKNHYKRTHCPKMYVCKRCNQKQFSVLSDLRTHEKHCGDLKWQCSCGTTFSRKDKLMGHVALFVGHLPLACDTTR